MYASTDVLEFNVMSYEQALNRFIQDGFFSEHLQMIEVHFISYEAYYDMHALTKIKLQFSVFGEVLKHVRT